MGDMKNELQQLHPAPNSPADRTSPSAQCAIILPLAEPGQALAACLASLVKAAGQARDDGTAAAIFVILAGHDADSALVASQYPVHLITTDHTDASMMRTIGARAAVTAGANWLAFTEPSAVVSERWLADQLECHAAVVLGGVEITDQFLLSARQADQSVQDEDRLDCANFGMDACAFSLLQHVTERDAGMDLALVRRLKGLGVSIKRCGKPHVYRRLEDSPAEELLADFAVTQLGGARQPAALV